LIILSVAAILLPWIWVESPTASLVAGGGVAAWAWVALRGSSAKRWVRWTVAALVALMLLWLSLLLVFLVFLVPEI
jgi:hypothetical protein